METFAAAAYETEDWIPLLVAARQASFCDPQSEVTKFLLSAAYARTGRPELADEMLAGLVDGPLRPHVLLEWAARTRSSDPWVAAAWLERFRAENSTSSAGWEWSSGALARARLAVGDVDGARRVLPTQVPARVRHRSPGLGAAASALVPGLGQAISGQPVEAASALVVVGALAATTAWAVESDRGGTAAVFGTVAVLFWSGSVYGGADSALRFNRRELRTVVERWDADGVPGGGSPPLPDGQPITSSASDAPAPTSAPEAGRGPGP